MNADGRNGGSWDLPPEDGSQAETLPEFGSISSGLTPRWTQPPLPAPASPSRLRRHPLILLALSVILVLAGGGSALAAVRGFNGQPTRNPSGIALATATATASPTVTPAPTIVPTATATQLPPQKV